MDSADQMTRAQALDPAYAARVVRAIADIERDYLFAFGALSERFMREAAVVIRQSAPEPWGVVGTEWEVSLTHPDWLSRGIHDVWLELGEIADDEEEHSWIAAAVGAGPTKLCLALAFRPGLVRALHTVAGDKGTTAQLLKAGFQQKPDDEGLFIPIAVNGEGLAKGFELNDFDKALAPLRSAVEKAVAAKAELDAFVSLVREQGKKK